MANNSCLNLMMGKEEVINVLRTEFPHLQKKYGLKTIGLFGSYARNNQHKESDLDFFVEVNEPLAKNYFGLWSYLEKKFNKKIDLVRKGDHLGQSFMQTVEKDIIYA